MTSDDLERTLDEHHGCMKVVAEVEECLGRYTDAAAGWYVEFVARLRTLEAALHAHFKGEEEGLFRKMPVDHPHLAPRFKELEDEHPRMLESLRGAIRKAEKLGGDMVTYRVGELRAQVQLLVATLRRHEAEENELVMTAQWTTFGTSD